jgi:hypothetical protein
MLIIVTNRLVPIAFVAVPPPGGKLRKLLTSPQESEHPVRRLGDQRGAGIAPSRGSSAFTFRTAASRNAASHRATERHALARGFLRLLQSADFLSCSSRRLLPNESQV